MQEKRDSIDEAIFEAFNEFYPSSDYNDQLIKKLHKSSFNRRESIKPLAVSLILSGIIAMVIYTSDIQFKIADFKYKVINQVLTMEYNYKNDVQRIIMGE
ncbi:hypothetical protein HMPREF1982_01346 [Clostridiales bacterium oral taxon 876 str. F0540]|nr:hypothetical protein HMPREF1982_01346 [Clostridiales bacterium oral taxon 876 str. F0540]